MNQDRFGKFLRKNQEDVQVDIPTEEIWNRIEQTRSSSLSVEAGGGRGSVVRWPVLRWPLAVAAVLVIGFMVGRVSAPGSDTPRGGLEPQVADAPLLPAFQGETLAHLAEVELMLTAFGADEEQLRSETIRWARDLVGNTRLLMESPVGSDPDLAELLGQLELVLAQIGSLAETSPAFEQELIIVSLEELDVLAKLDDAAREGFFGDGENDNE